MCDEVSGGDACAFRECSTLSRGRPCGPPPPAQLARDATPDPPPRPAPAGAVVAPCMPAPPRPGRPRLWPMRLVFDAIQYVLRTGCAWAHLPHEFPPHETVHRWFLRLSRSGAFEAMMRVLTALDRACAGRDPLPTAAIMDAQAARSGTVGVAGQRGYDPARRVVGRKRHALVDTDGRLLAACWPPASLHDSHGGIALLKASREHWPFLQRCFADSAYAGDRVAGATAIAVTIVSAPPGQKGFAVQPRRWVIERSFAHAGRCRRLARDHEATDDATLGFFVLANAMRLVRRLAKEL